MDAPLSIFDMFSTLQGDLSKNFEKIDFKLSVLETRMNGLESSQIALEKTVKDTEVGKSIIGPSRRLLFFPLLCRYQNFFVLSHFSQNILNSPSLYTWLQTWGEVLFKVFKYIPSTLQILRIQYEYKYRFQYL